MILQRIVGQVVRTYRLSYAGPDHAEKVGVPEGLSVGLDSVD